VAFFTKYLQFVHFDVQPFDEYVPTDEALLRVNNRIDVVYSNVL
jgi:hypothetical protein